MLTNKNVNNIVIMILILCIMVVLSTVSMIKNYSKKQTTIITTQENYCMKKQFWKKCK